MTRCLLLHGIGPLSAQAESDETPYWISKESFAALVEILRTVPTRLTFDDGNKTDATIAAPALLEAGLTASFFIPSARINTDGYVNEGDIRELHEAGMEIGSHGFAHVDWTTLGDAEIAHDVRRSVEQLSAIINAPVRSVAIPFGNCDRRVLAVLRNLGIGRVYSSFRGPDFETKWLVCRDCITTDMTREHIERLIRRKPAVAETALNLLRVWRRAGNAALWAA